jgi:hypothetical protein
MSWYIIACIAVIVVIVGAIAVTRSRKGGGE